MKKRRSIPFKIYLTPEENQIIQARVEAAGLSRSQYGHLALTSPFIEQLQQAEIRESEQHDLCLLLGKHYTALSLIESHLAALKSSSAPSEQRLLLKQLQAELKQIKTEVHSLAQKLLVQR